MNWRVLACSKNLCPLLVQYFLDARIAAVKAVVFRGQAGCNAAHDLVSQFLGMLFAVVAVNLR